MGRQIHPTDASLTSRPGCSTCGLRTDGASCAGAAPCDGLFGPGPLPEQPDTPEPETEQPDTPVRAPARGNPTLAEASSPSVMATRAQYASTTPSRAGAGTTRAKPTPPTDSSSPSRQASATPAQYASTTPSRAGADNGQTDAPDGQTCAGAYYSCGLRTDNAVVCWGIGGDNDTPEGQFKAIVGDHAGTACGGAIGSALPRWAGHVGQPDHSSTTPTPPRQFLAIGGRCRSIVCWGEGYDSE